MENETAAPKTHLTFGILIGVIMVLIFVVLYVFGFATNRSLGLLPALVLIVLIIIAQINHAKALDGHITYGNLFATGFKTTCVATCIFIVFLAIFIWVVPDYKTMMLEMIREKMAQNRQLTEDQINKAMGVTKRFFTISAIGGSILQSLFIGCIGSLIGAGVAKKKPAGGGA